MNRSDRILLDQKVGDVTGDQVADVVSLTGSNPFPDTPLVDNVVLSIKDGRSNEEVSFALPGSAGYNPTLYLGRFTDKNVNEILVRTDSGGSGGMTYDFLYSFYHRKLRLLFDNDSFANAFSYDVNYLDYYQAEIKNYTLNKTYIVSLLYKGKEYLSSIYNSDGKLKEPISGYVNAPGGVYPIDFQRDGIDELLVYQRVIGRYNADGLGTLSTPLQWRSEGFVPMYQTLCIY